MLEFKGQAPKPTPSMANAQAANHKHDWLSEFDFLRVLVEFFSAPAWGTQRLEPRPIPVKVRNRR